jgi:hypothetical protein
VASFDVRCGGAVTSPWVKPVAKPQHSGSRRGGQDDSQRVEIVADLAFLMDYRAEVDRAVRLNIARQLRDIASHFDRLADEVHRSPAMEDIPHQRLRCVPLVEELIYSWERRR